MYSEDEIIQLEKVLNGMFPGCPVLVQDRSVRPAEFRNCTDKIPQELTVTEGGLNFLIHPLRGQNPGFFSDMRSARRYVITSYSIHYTKLYEGFSLRKSWW